MWYSFWAQPGALPVSASGTARPARGVGEVARGLAPAQLLRLVRVAQAGPGEEAVDAAGQ